MFIPFSYLWDINQELGELNAVIDIGCGTGFFGQTFNKPKRFKLIGIDLFEPYLKKAKSSRTYDITQIVDLNHKLPYSNKAFEAVVCLQTVEHLKKNDGIRLLNEAERIAKNKVIITVPVGQCIQESYDNNKLQEHLSTWTVSEFKERGYTVRGVGIKFIYGNRSYARRKVIWWKLPLYFLSFLLNPVTYFIPEMAAQMIAIKKISK